MVTRSTTGTGVVVSLVVFVLCTVFLLILTIVFYSGQTKAHQDQLAAEATLAKYVTKEQRGREAIKAMEANIKTRQGESVVRLLLEKQEDIMRYVAGNETATLDSVRSQFKNLGVAENTSVRDSLQRLRRDLNSRQSEIEGYKTKITAREREIGDLEDRMEQARENHQQELNAVVGKIAAYEQAAGDYRDQLNDVKSEYYGILDRLEDRYEGDIARLENEKDNLFQERVILKERLDELQSILSVNRLRAQDPAKSMTTRPRCRTWTGSPARYRAARRASRSSRSAQRPPNARSPGASRAVRSFGTTWSPTPCTTPTTSSSSWSTASSTSTATVSPPRPRLTSSGA